MTDHDDVVRSSFARQVGLFSGPDSPFVRRETGTATERLEPLDASMLVLDVACGAGHAAEVVAPQVRQVVGVLGPCAGADGRPRPHRDRNGHILGR